MAITVTAIEKKGPVIICHTNDSKNRAYKLDFQKAKVYGLNGRALRSTTTIIDKIPIDYACDSVYFTALRAFTDSDYCSNASYYPVVESLLSYPDLLTPLIDKDMVRYIIANYDGKLPKGYVNWSRKNHRQFSKYTLTEFVTEERFKQWPQALADSVKKFSAGTGINLIKETQADKELCVSIMHIANNSLKRYEIEGLIRTLEQILFLLQDKPQLRPYLDDTKNAKTAYQILEEISNKERNEKILTNEAKIAALNGVVVDGLMIKVPSTISDFTDEGEQQHNCVGYYYHNAMANGAALIYFLRQIDTPDKSYITCRFNIDKKQTVEHRLACNVWFSDNQLFKKIDDMITSLLEI